jgi:hypothetical protein
MLTWPIPGTKLLRNMCSRTGKLINKKFIVDWEEE